MPDAKLPNTPAGWLVALGAGIVGFFAGFVFIMLARSMFGG